MRHPPGNFYFLQTGEFSANGFVEQQAVGKNITKGARRPVNQGAPVVGIVADDLPALIPRHPFLQMGVERLVRGGLRREIIRRQPHRPGNVTLKGADKIQVRWHPPIRQFAGGDFMEQAEKLRQKRLEARFHFRAGNVVGGFKRQPQIKVPHPSFHERQIPFLGIKQNQRVDVPSEEKFRARTGRLLVRVINQAGIVSIAAFDGSRHFHLPGQHQFVVAAVNPQIRTLPVGSLGFFNLRAGKVPGGVLRKERIRPLGNAAAKCHFMSANVPDGHGQSIAGGRGLASVKAAKTGSNPGAFFAGPAG